METETTQIALFYRFGSAMLLGLLVGLQREYASGRRRDDADDARADRRQVFAGVRTYTLLALLGSTGALVAEMSGSPAAFAAVLLIIGGMMSIAYYVSAREGQIGLTSEVAALLTVLAGALCFWGELAFAAALAVTITVVLALKVQTRSFAQSITSEDVRATLTFAVLTLIILPVLPTKGFAGPPFDVLVPHKIWLMVVFISGISFLGYVMIKVVGAQRGVGLTGLLGGLASSTAVTLSFSQRSRSLAGFAKPFALAILLSWAVMFARVLIEVAALNGPLLRVVALPMGAAGAVCLAYCAYLYFSANEDQSESDDDFKNPFELGPALAFGFIYMVILLGANAARIYFGDAGLYVSSIVSGLADVDAITLSIAELAGGDDGLELSTGARAIVMAAASNTLVKGSIVLTAGSASLRKVILPGLVLTVGTAIGVVFLV